MLSTFAGPFTLGLLFVLIMSTDAWAYIDPGTGTYLFQLLIAGGLAGVYTLRRYFSAARAWFERAKGSR